MLKYNAKTGEKTTEDVPDAPPIVTAIDPEVSALRREYLDATSQLCALAGMPYAGKLSNVDYKIALTRSATHAPAGVIAATLVYCRTCLFELEGDQWWDNMGDMQ